MCLLVKCSEECRGVCGDVALNYYLFFPRGPSCSFSPRFHSHCLTVLVQGAVSVIPRTSRCQSFGKECVDVRRLTLLRRFYVSTQNTYQRTITSVFPSPSVRRSYLHHSVLLPQTLASSFLSASVIYYPPILYSILSSHLLSVLICFITQSLLCVFSCVVFS